MESKKVVYKSGSHGLSHKAKIMPNKEVFTTDFSWYLHDWVSFFDIKHSGGVRSDPFPLDGIDDCTCQVSINPKISDSPLTIEFSDTTLFKEIRICIYINGQKLFDDYFKQPFSKIINPPNIDLQQFKTQTTPTDQDDKSLKIAVWFFITRLPKSHRFRCEKEHTNSKKLIAMYENTTLCDVIFVLGNEELPAHKVVLATQSEVFESMFLTEMKEKKTNRVEIVDIRVEVFEEFLKYFYIGKVKDLENMAEELLVAADKYQVCELKELCENYLLRDLCGTNVVKYLIIADKYCCTTLKKKAISILEYNAEAWKQGIISESIESLIHLKNIMKDNLLEK